MIKYIILHCSATEAGKDFQLGDINRWHRKRGWLCVGYHFVIPLNGELQRGRRIGSKGAHCLYYNDCSIGICYVGGLVDGQYRDTRTPSQLRAMELLVKQLLRQFPHALVCGHRDLDSGKACPCFDTAEWAERIGIPKENIYRRCSTI